MVDVSGLRYYYRRKPITPGGDVEIPGDVICQQIRHDKDGMTYVEWLEPKTDQ